MVIQVERNVKTVAAGGGYTSFQSCFPYLCESQNRPPCPARAPLSQPCLPVTNTGPTRVLGFLYLGSQQDVMSEECLKNYGINYVLNVSRSCPIPEFLPQTHFHRIPVRDNHGEKILPWFDEALEFIDKVRSANGSVIVHCLAGISRSPTVAIAFIMRYLNMNVDEAYKYVKEKRATISPNFNFLGQLLEYEKIIRTRQGLPSTLQPSGPPKEDVEPSEMKEKEEGACASEHSSMLTSPKAESSKVTYPRKGLEESMLPMRPNIRKLSLENLSLPLKCSYMPGKASPRLSRTLPRVTFADAPTTPTSENKSIKRSLSRDALTEVGTQTLVTEKRSTSHLTLDLMSAPSRTLQRPTGLDVKKTVLLLNSPGDSKKSRSLCNSPSGLLEQLAWGTSHLSVHSPEVRNNNPFVEACAKFQAQQTGLSTGIQRSHPENSKSKVERKKLKLEGLISNSETICAEVQAAENLIPAASGSSVLTAPASPSTSRSQRHKHSETSVGFQFGRSRINHPDPASSNTRVANSSATQDQQKPSALKKPTFGPQNSPPPIQSSAAVVGGNVSNPFFSRQSSGQSVTSDLSLSSTASPALDPSGSSWMHGSVSSGISPDINLSSAASSACSSANLKPDSSQKSKGLTDMETPQVLPSGWNPFSFPQAKADDSPTSRGDSEVWQKRKESGNSVEESSQSQKIHQSPTTAMDRVATYITKCNFGSPDVSDSDSSEPTHPHKKKCNNKKRPKLHPSIRSQSCEEIGSCSREVVTSEIVVSARREILEYGRSALDQDEEDFDTRSLSSQRSLSSSCEMIEVS
ncbi:tyrosine-protein phosphatase vhp-1 isoform X2 [Strongylocentrotus purpuratus]|uniref:protein-tyrosine-phosphatase n=1 Tax=Strongylocentrotus purpuratus TaxID=7668 RepID=A0A7M7GGN3_STRPU|nr:tyrosine-protein phosphatase vhp-1 isoform X2 [Strongylocentrotus purpuratus]|eukprot:XP_003725447.1 PREDICTED: tyrosine-protein phosphatase vhp-1 isoform X3 [Strongylocentrotus purpuratus]